MTTHYVNSNATGANTGASAADAWTSIASAQAGAAAGDLILIDKTHSESFGVTTSLSFPGTIAAPLQILCVDFAASNALSTGATIAVSASGPTLNLQGFLWVRGLTLQTFGSIGLCATAGNRQVWEDCTLKINPAAGAGNRRFNLGGGGTTASVLLLKNCTIDLDTNGGSGSVLNFTGTTRLQATDCSIRANAAAPAICSGSVMSFATLDGCDLGNSGCTTLWNYNAGAARVVISRCNLPASYVPTTGTPDPGSSFVIERSTSGTITAPPLGLTYYQDHTGSIKSVLSTYRTGGASDGDQANPISWEMDAGTGAIPILDPLRTLDLDSEWVTAGSSKTFTIYCAGASQLDASQLWLELSGPSNASPANTAGYNANGRADPQSAAGLVSLDVTSTWNGAGAGAPMQMSLSYTPTIDGPVTLRVCLAKPSTTIFLDPKVYVS